MSGSLLTKGEAWRRQESKTEEVAASVLESAESCGVTVELADARGPSATSAVLRRSTVELGDVGELIVRIIEATAASPARRDRMQLANGFAEDVARSLAELNEQL